MAWGDVTKELRPLEPYNLFDLSQVTHVLNLQIEFSHYWNSTHPHTEECLTHCQRLDDDLRDENILVCFINPDDLEENSAPSNRNDNHSACICPNEICPYKTKNALWSLQTAIHYTFDQALDKSMTLNFWSCGIDPALRTWRSPTDRHTCQTLLTYAINDLFTPTNLFFTFNPPQPQSHCKPFHPTPILLRLSF